MSLKLNFEKGLSPYRKITLVKTYTNPNNDQIAEFKEDFLVEGDFLIDHEYPKRLTLILLGRKVNPVSPIFKYTGSILPSTRILKRSYRHLH